MRITNIEILRQCLNDIAFYNRPTIGMQFYQITKTKTFKALTIDKKPNFYNRFLKWAIKNGYARKPLGYMPVLTIAGSYAKYSNRKLPDELNSQW